MKIGIFLLLLTAFLSTYAQVSQKGVVRELNSNKKPLAGVQIIVWGAIATSSDVKGNFTLKFNDKNPGDRILKKDIFKVGYEVINVREIENWVLSSGQDTLKVIMSPTGERIKNIDKYYNLGLTAIITSHEKKIKSLKTELDQRKISLEEHQEKVRKLEQQLMKMKESELQVIAQEFANTNFDDAQPIIQKAYEIFLSGDLEKAIQLLEQSRLPEQLMNNQNTLERIRKDEEDLTRKKNAALSERQTIIKALYFKAKCHLLALNLDSAESCLQTIAVNDTSEFVNSFAFAWFLQYRKNMESAEKWYNISARHAQSDIDRASVISQLAKICKEKNDIAEAERLLGESIRIKKNERDKTEQILSELAADLNNLALIQAEKLQISEAVLTYKAAEELFHNAGLNNLKKYYPELIVVYNNLGNLYQTGYHFRLAREYYSRSLKLLNTFVKDSVYRYLPLTAMTLYNMAGILTGENNYKEALRYYKEALSIYKGFLSQGVSIYRSEYALVLNGIAMLQNQYGFQNEARVALSEAVRINGALASECPAIYLPAYAVTINNLANLIREKSPDSAMNYYLDCIKIYRGLEEKAIHTYAPDLASSLSNLGTIQSTLGKTVEAEHSLKESLGIYRELVKNNPTRFQPKEARVLSSLAEVLMVKNSNEEALSNLLESLKILDNLPADVKPLFQSDKAKMNYLQGQLNARIKKTSKAMESFNESLFIYKELSVSSPGIYNKEIANIYHRTGDIFLDKGILNEAYNRLSEALRIYRLMDNKIPGCVNSEMAQVLYSMGVIKDMDCLPLDAIKYLKESCALALESCHKGTGQEPIDVARSLQQLARLYILNQKPSEAFISYCKLDSVARQTERKKPGTGRLYLSLALTGKAYVRYAENSSAEAEKYLSEAVNLLQTPFVEPDVTVAGSIAFLLCNIAEIQDAAGEYQGAFIQYQIALKIYEDIVIVNSSLTREIDITIYNMALMLNKLADRKRENKEYNAAIDIYSSALILLESQSDEFREKYALFQSQLLLKSCLCLKKTNEGILDQTRVNQIREYLNKAESLVRKHRSEQGSGQLLEQIDEMKKWFN